MSLLLPFAEIGLGVLLFLGVGTLPAAGAALALVGLFTGATAANMVRGRLVPCGCFGTGVDGKGWSVIIRNGGLVALASLALSHPTGLVAAGSTQVPASAATSLVVAAGLLAVVATLAAGVAPRRSDDRREVGSGKVHASARLMERRGLMKAGTALAAAFVLGKLATPQPAAAIPCGGSCGTCGYTCYRLLSGCYDCGSCPGGVKDWLYEKWWCKRCCDPCDGCWYSLCTFQGYVCTCCGCCT